MAFNHGHNGRPKFEEAIVKKIVSRNVVRCQFCCCEGTVDPNTLTCSSCNTTAARNYGSTQRKDRHGRKIDGVK